MASDKDEALMSATYAESLSETEQSPLSLTLS